MQRPIKSSVAPIPLREKPGFALWADVRDGPHAHRRAGEETDWTAQYPLHQRCAAAVARHWRGEPGWLYHQCRATVTIGGFCTAHSRLSSPESKAQMDALRQEKREKRRQAIEQWRRQHPTIDRDLIYAQERRPIRAWCLRLAGMVLMGSPADAQAVIRMAIEFEDHLVAVGASIADITPAQEASHDPN